MTELSGIQPGQHAIDLCCGTGVSTRALLAAGATVVGVDASGPMLQIARNTLEGNARLVHCNVDKTRFPKAHAVFCNAGFGHIGNKPALYRKVYEALCTRRRVCLQHSRENSGLSRRLGAGVGT